MEKVESKKDKLIREQHHKSLQLSSDREDRIKFLEEFYDLVEKEDKTEITILQVKQEQIDPEYNCITLVSPTEDAKVAIAQSPTYIILLSPNNKAILGKFLSAHILRKGEKLAKFLKENDIHEDEYFLAQYYNKDIDILEKDVIFIKYKFVKPLMLGVMAKAT